MISRVGVLLAAILLGGCVGSAPSPPNGAPLLPHTLSPATLGYNLSLSQLVTGEYGGEVTSTRLVAVGLSPLGLPLFEFEQVGDRVTARQLGGEQGPVDPRQVISDLQLTYWPEDVLRPALAAAGYRLESDPVDHSRRVFSSDGLLQAEISFESRHGAQDDIVIRHFYPRYTVRVTAFEPEG